MIHLHVASGVRYPRSIQARPPCPNKCPTHHTSDPPHVKHLWPGEALLGQPYRILRERDQGKMRVVEEMNDFLESLIYVKQYAVKDTAQAGNSNQ